MNKGLASTSPVPLLSSLYQIDTLPSHESIKFELLVHVFLHSQCVM